MGDVTAEQAQQTLEQMKKALATGGEAGMTTSAAFSKKLENAQQKGYTESNYWHPNLTKSELGNLRQLVRSDIKTSANNINERANWYSTRIDGQPVFAIYSTADASDPTILYAGKGEQASLERSFLIYWRTLKMENILTENQRILTRYLAAVGCRKDAVLYMMAALWEKDATLEMLEFCKNNPNASPAQLLSAASKIHSKYERAMGQQNILEN